MQFSKLSTRCLVLLVNENQLTIFSKKIGSYARATYRIMNCPDRKITY